MGWDLQINVWHVLSFMISGAVAIYAHIISRQRVTEDDLKQHKEVVTKELNGFGQRLVRVEESDRHAPTHADLGAVHDKLNDMNGSISEVVGELRGVQATLRLINQHMLDKS